MQQAVNFPAYLVTCVLSFEGIVDKAAVDNRDESTALDMARKVKVSLRLFDVPFFLKFGGSFSVI